MKKQWPVLEGDIKIALSYLCSEGHKDYALVFYKGSTKIARMYYHAGAKEIILNVRNGIVLRKTAFKFLEQFYDIKLFRHTRKGLQRFIKKELTITIV